MSSQSLVKTIGNMITRMAVILLGLVAGISTGLSARDPLPPKPVSIEVSFLSGSRVTAGQTLSLDGESRRQMLVTATMSDGKEVDYTRAVSYKVSPSSILTVDKAGSLQPLRNGRAVVTVRSPEGITAKLEATIAGVGSEKSVNFANQIVPIFTKTGCNGGGCHGKSGGQNGFRLSLLGFEPGEDYEYLVKEARGRRLFPAAPENSLLLLKGAAILPHGGGKRLEPDSDDYRLLVRWIGQGMPYGDTNAPSVARIEVVPAQRTLPMNGGQQLVVLAHYTDGSVEDVTRSALYEPNDKNMARTGETGEVRMFDQPGDVAVMVRYQGKVSVFRATIPLGAPVESLPAPRNFIDELVFNKLRAIGLPPSEPCDDATFIRRVTLDIAGRLPTVDETRRFLDDKDAAKRDKLIDGLLDSPDYAEYFANKWSALLRNKRSAPTQMRGTYAFWNWVRDALHENKPYDRFVGELLTASGDVIENPPVAWYRQVREPHTEMEDVAQLFLGTRLQCAQCHHHPYERWSQQDYYGLTAFFTQVARKNSGQPGEEIVFARRAMPAATNKKTKQPVGPAGLGAEPVKLTPDDDAREALAGWMTRADNPFFAKSLVNRYWKHFFNRALVEPEDDMRETNPAVNPELLAALSDHFTSSGYDLKQLVRTITQSRAYQLSAVPNAYNKVDRQNFSRYYPKRLNAEVLFDAVNVMTLAESRFEGLPPGTRAVALPDNSFNASSYFLTVFGRPDSSSACECERSQEASLAQSLHLLNARDIQDKIAAANGRAAQFASDTARADEEKVRDLYYMAFSRGPSPEELALAKHHLEKQVKDKDGKETPIARRQAFEDIVWALVNTKEFLFNH